MIRFLAVCALVPAAASVYFPIFWLGLAFWRRHVVLTFALMLGTIGAWTAIAIVGRDPLLARGVDMPVAAQAVGWALVALALVVGMIADRQLGVHVRSFMPFFAPRGRIALRTTGAYAIVRHPIYACGIGFQLGMFLVTGAYAIAAAAVVLGAGAAWFTRREERALQALLEDPSAYERYRARVPALLPFPRSGRFPRVQ